MTQMKGFDWAVMEVEPDGAHCPEPDGAGG